jgi:integrase
VASVTKRGKKWIVRWRDPDGTERIRTCPDKVTAEALSRDVERLKALGRRWEVEVRVVVPPLVAETIDPETGKRRATGGLFRDFIADRRRTCAPDTIRHYETALGWFFDWLTARHPGVELTPKHLTLSALAAWYDDLRRDGTRGIARTRLVIGAVQSAWDWAWDSDVYGQHTERPRKLDMPTPSYGLARAPSWAEMDAAIFAAHALADACRAANDALGYRWRADLFVVLRFTGLREQQAMRLTWDDVDLEAGLLTIRGELGKSHQERSGRVVPIAKPLLEELRTWGRRDLLEGRGGGATERWLIAPHKEQRTAPSPQTTACWEASGVPPAVWRGHPHHCFRKGFKSGLLRHGADPAVRDYLVGHHQGVDAHYLDLVEIARESVDLIPPVQPPPGAGKIVDLAKAAATAGSSAEAKANRARRKARRGGS